MTSHEEPGTAPRGAAPVLLLAGGHAARAIQAALGPTAALTITDDVARARALAATGGFVAILAVEPLAASLREAVVIDPGTGAGPIAEAVAAAIARSHRLEREDQVAALSYDEYSELARYAATRRYLIALLHRHGGSVTDAARGAKLKRESLHRLMRRHHVIADAFREG